MQRKHVILLSIRLHCFRKLSSQRKLSDGGRTPFWTAVHRRHHRHTLGKYRWHENNRIANNLFRLAAKKPVRLDKTREFIALLLYRIIVLKTRVYLRVEKALDRLWHEGLLHKLTVLKAPLEIIIDSFLTDLKD